jgi:hypothetical protein
LGTQIERIKQISAVLRAEAREARRESDSSGRAAKPPKAGRGTGADSATPQKKQQPNLGCCFFVGTRPKNLRKNFYKNFYENFRWREPAISTKNAHYKNASYLTTYYFLLTSQLQNA